MECLNLAELHEGTQSPRSFLISPNIESKVGIQYRCLDGSVAASEEWFWVSAELLQEELKENYRRIYISMWIPPLMATEYSGGASRW